MKFKKFKKKLIQPFSPLISIAVHYNDQDGMTFTFQS